jgi:phosphatidylserine/phosphatidylglycerophosphate/cardiolipin synthase-like enzyme
MPVKTIRFSWPVLLIFGVSIFFTPPGAAAFFSLPTGPTEKEDRPADAPAPLPPGMVPAAVKVLADREFQAALENEIAAASFEITLSAYLFAAKKTLNNRPRAIADRLIEAAGRGVKVEVILEIGRESAAVTQTNREAARLLGPRGVKVSVDTSGTTVHSRFVVIDRRLVFTGSHDLTENSLGNYREISLLAESPALAAALLGQLASLNPAPYAEAPPRPPSKKTGHAKSPRSR